MTISAKPVELRFPSYLPSFCYLLLLLLFTSSSSCSVIFIFSIFSFSHFLSVLLLFYSFLLSSFVLPVHFSFLLCTEEEKHHPRRVRSSRMWRCIAGYLVPGVSKNRICSIFSSLWRLDRCPHSAASHHITYHQNTRLCSCEKLEIYILSFPQTVMWRRWKIQGLQSSYSHWN